MLIRPSPLGAVLVGAIHALAAFAVYVSLPALAALICVAGIVISAGVQGGRLLHWSRRSVRELTLQPDGSAAWRDGDGAWHAAREVTGGVLAPWLMVIGLKETGRSLQSLLLLPDAAAAEARRELRVWLRWRPQPGHPAGIGVIHAMWKPKDPGPN